MPYIDDPSVTRKVPGVDFTGRVPGSSPRGEVARCDYVGVPRVARFREYGTLVHPPDPQEGFPYIYVMFKRTGTPDTYAFYRIPLEEDGVTLKSPGAGAAWVQKDAPNDNDETFNGIFAFTRDGVDYMAYNAWDTFKVFNLTTEADVASLNPGPWNNPDPAFGYTFYNYGTLQRIAFTAGGGQIKIADFSDVAVPALIGDVISVTGTDFYNISGTVVDPSYSIHTVIQKTGGRGYYRNSVIEPIASSPTFEYDDVRLIGGSCGGVTIGGTPYIFHSRTFSGRFFTQLKLTGSVPTLVGHVANPTGAGTPTTFIPYRDPVTLKYYLICITTTTSTADSRECYIYDLSSPEAPSLKHSLCDPSYGAGRLPVEGAWGGCVKGDKVYFWHGGSALANYADEGIWVIDLADMENPVATPYTRVPYGPGIGSLGLDDEGKRQFWMGGPHGIGDTRLSLLS